MDVVAPVRVGDRNEELRFALRSFAANVPHDRVWIIGHKPPWLRGVEHIKTRQGSSKYANTTLAMRLACTNPDISDPFIWTMDDVFRMVPLKGPTPTYHRGPISGVEQYYANRRVRGRYYTGMVQTRRLLEKLGHSNPLSYEVHVPLIVHKQEMLEALDIGAKVPVLHKRSLYGNLAMLGGTRIVDPKVLHMTASYNRNAEWLSTLDSTFTRGSVGRFIRSKFPQPCRYEGSPIRRLY